MIAYRAVYKFKYLFRKWFYALLHSSLSLIHNNLTDLIAESTLKLIDNTKSNTCPLFLSKKFEIRLKKHVQNVAEKMK